MARLVVGRSRRWPPDGALDRLGGPGGRPGSDVLRGVTLGGDEVRLGATLECGSEPDEGEIALSISSLPRMRPTGLPWPGCRFQ